MPLFKNIGDPLMGKAICGAVLFHGVAFAALLLGDDPSAGRISDPDLLQPIVVETHWDVRVAPSPEVAPPDAGHSATDVRPVETQKPQRMNPVKTGSLETKPKLADVTPSLKPDIPPKHVRTEGTSALVSPPQTKPALRKTQKISAVAHKHLISPPSVEAKRPTKATYPAYLKNPRPTYPKSAQKRRQEGIVQLEVTVSKTGIVSQIRLYKSCGHRKLDQSALKTVRSWRFVPASVQGQKIKSTVIVPIRFFLKDKR